jgi:hypothetical protein
MGTNQTQRNCVYEENNVNSLGIKHKEPEYKNPSNAWALFHLTDLCVTLYP